MVIYDDNKNKFRPWTLPGESVILTPFFRGKTVRSNGLVRLGYPKFDRVGLDGRRTRFRVGLNLQDRAVPFTDTTIRAKEIKPYYPWELGQLMEAVAGARK